MNNNLKAREQIKKPLIPTSKERVRVVISLVILVVAAIIVFLINSNNTANLRSIRKYAKDAGTVAEVGFFFAIAMFVIRRIIKKVDLKGLKPIAVKIAKLTRDWHVPIAVTAYSIIIVHAYIMLSRGSVYNFTSLSGIAALVVLSILMISGIFRYKRKGVKLHMVLGISFIVLMLIHLI